MDRPSNFQVLISERRWRDHETFRRKYELAAQHLAEREGPPGLRTSTIGRRQFMRWAHGKLEGLPRSDARRILEYLFQMPVEQLFGTSGQLPAAEHPATSAAPSPEPHSGGDDVVMTAARESANFAARAERTNVGPHTLDQLQADIQRIIATYPNRPIMPVFLEVRELRNRAFELLEGNQPPQYTRDLYLAAGTLCGILANASFDLGKYGAAETQARTAYLCGELVGHNGLRAWVRGMQALVAYWDERPLDALHFCEAGQHLLPEEGTAHIRLASIAARALGKLGRAEKALAALRSAEDHRARLGAGDVDAGMMAFPEPKQALYASTTQLWLGTDGDLTAAEQQASTAIAGYEAAPPEQRRLGELCLARVDLAQARLGRNEVEGAAEQIDLVLGIESRRRTESVGRRLTQFGRRLSLSPAATAPQSVHILDRIATYHDRRTPELPSGGTAR